MYPRLVCSAMREASRVEEELEEGTPDQGSPRSQNDSQNFAASRSSPSAASGNSPARPYQGGSPERLHSTPGASPLNLYPSSLTPQDLPGRESSAPLLPGGCDSGAGSSGRGDEGSGGGGRGLGWQKRKQRGPVAGTASRSPSPQKRGGPSWVGPAADTAKRLSKLKRMLSNMRAEYERKE